jgi:5-keto 4-deoxyuronate isomerase
MHQLPTHIARNITTEELRSAFVQGLFTVSRIVAPLDLDRVVSGCRALGTTSSRCRCLAAAYFTERRELDPERQRAAPSAWTAIDTPWTGATCWPSAAAARMSCSSDDAALARFYLVSYPAHGHPTTRVSTGPSRRAVGERSANRAAKVHPRGSGERQTVMGVSE